MTMKTICPKFFKAIFYFQAILAFFAQPTFAQTNLITNGDFENGTTGWQVWGATMTASTDAHSGNGAAKISNRKNQWDAIAFDLTKILESGQEFNLSAWLKFASNTKEFRATIQLDVDGVKTYHNYFWTTSPSIGSYKFYTGIVNLSWTGNLKGAYLYFETGSVDGVYTDYIIDDVKLVKNAKIEDIVHKGKGLKDIKSTMLIGGCVTEGSKNIFTNEAAKAQVLMDCNTVTVQCYPGWGRWDNTKRHVYHVDEFTDQAREMKKYGMRVTAHMLLGWDQYFPGWYKNNDFPADTLEAIMQSWLKGIITYQGNDTLVDIWNVVNESISWNGKGGYWPIYNANFNDACELQRMGFEPDASGLTGSQFVNSEHPVYIRKAFEYVRTLTDKKLELRETSMEFPGDQKYNAFYQLAVHLKKMNAPVDVIGFQTHLNINGVYDWEAYANNIKRFVKLGYEVIIPEVDMGDTEKDWTEEKAQKQKKQYYNLITAAIKGGASDFQTWGFIDDGWRPGERAFPYTSNFEQKPAYFGIKEALIDMSSTLFWEMDEAKNDTMPDVMKYNNFGKLNYFGTPVFVEGFKKNALQFDGVDDYIETEELSEKISGDFTFSCYIKTGAQKPGTIADFTESGNSWLKIGINNMGKIIVSSPETVLNESLESTKAVNDNIWHFVTVQRDSTSYRLYIDDSTPVAVAMGNVKEFSKLLVGAGNGVAEPFEGAMDEIKLYDSAIEEASFTRNYTTENQPVLDYIYNRMRVKLTWTNKSNEKVGFVIDRKIAGGNWEKVGEVNANTLVYIENLELYDTTYSYRVRAASKFEKAGTSNIVAVQTPKNPNTGIDDVDGKFQLLVYPNPVRDKFTLITTRNVWMKIYDVQGNLMMEKNKCADIETIDITGFVNGIYFIHSNNGNKIQVAKLVKY
jgi:GH35 family endo-1,4-beta-xylanase